MSSSTSSDVVIVGNGVLAYAVAYRLATRSPDLSVTVCGPRGRTGGASVAAGAMLNTFGEITRRTLRSEPGRMKFELSREALDLWPTWLADVKSASGWDDLDRTLTTGTTVILNSRSGMLDNENFAALESALARYEEPYEEIDPAGIPGLMPLPDARPLRALHLAREGAIDAREFLAGLQQAAARSGVRSLDAQVSRLCTEAGRITGIELADGTSVSTGTVIVAAGAFSGELLAGVLEPGATPMMFSGRGIAFVTQRADLEAPRFESVVRTPTRAGNCGLHMVPFRDGREYYGATNVVYDRPGHLPDLGMSEFLIRVAREQLDQRLFFADIEWKVGNRPMAVDGFPMVGRTGVDGLIVCTASYRDGFHCSPALSAYVADDVLGVSSLADRFPLFRPERAPIELYSPEEAVDELVGTAVAGSWEVGVSLPGWHVGLEPFDAHYRQAMSRFYDVLKRPVALAPEILLAVLWAPNLSDHPLTRYLAEAIRRYGD